jgi:PAS domain S-box-containing protein
VTVPLVFLAALIAACCAALAALIRHSRERLRRIEALNKNLECTAAEQSDQLHAILAAVRVGTWRHDLISNRMALQGRVVLESPNEVHGFPPRIEHSFDELLGAIHPEDRARFQEACRLTAEGTNTSIDLELRVVQPDNSVRWILWEGGISRSSEGKPVCLGGINLDITKRKNAEIALRQSETEVRKLNETLEQRVKAGITELLDSEQRFRLMVEGVQDYAIFMLDTEGRVVSWNLGAERIYGYSAEEILGSDHTAKKIVGKHFSIFCPEDDIRRGDPEEELRLASIEGRAEREVWRVRRDGSRFWASVLVTAVHDDSGDLCGFSNVTRDVTERRRAQEQLEEQRRGAEQANQAKSGFLAAMSHEIRTPMNAILGMTDLLWETELNEEQRHFVEIFRMAGANLMDLINNILDLSKIESGRLELERTEFNLETVVTGVVELLSPKAREKGIVVRWELAPDATRRLLGDAARLRQILVNLVGNAIKFTALGEVAISVGHREGGPPGELSFTVSDTGVGIPPEKLKAIFDPFTQGDSSIANRYGGTGLGLAICRRLVESMDGVLYVMSEPGRGSSFHFTARFDPARFDPAADSQPAVRADTGVTPAAPARIAARKLLIAEDSPDNQFLIQAYLKHQPYTLAFVADGKAAVNKCVNQWAKQSTEGPFDAILMDVKMPVMDGLTATRAIREMEQKGGRRPVPILALTANAEREDIEAGRLAGCTAHLSKPVSKAALLRAVEDLFAGERHSEQPKTEIPITPPEGVESLVPRYLSARRKELCEMVACLAASDFEQISSRGHDMKGTGRSYGFPAITDIGAALERLAQHEDKDGIDKQLLRLANYLESVGTTAEVKG